MYRIRNFTPHDIVLVGENGETLQTFVSEGIARCAQNLTPIRNVEVGENTIVVNKTVYGEPEGLPEPEEDTLIIVSALVAGAAPTRSDLIYPGEQVRNSKGQVIGCKSFARP